MNPSMYQHPRTGPAAIQRSPHAGARQRGVGPMIPGAPPRYTAEQTQFQAQNAKAQMDGNMASRKARAPTDLNLPDGIEETVIGDGVQQYKKLQEIEGKLDATMMRMRLQIQDDMFRRPKYYRTMRVFIWNTVKDQPWQSGGLEQNAFDFNTDLQGSYKIFINGKLLPEEDPIEEETDADSGSEEDSTATDRGNKDDAMDTDEGAKSKKRKKAQVDEEVSEDPDKPSPIQSKTKLSHFFKAITVDMHRDSHIQLQPDGTTTLEWKKPPPQPNAQTLAQDADFDILDFERKGEENINCTVNFYLDEEPERYQLSPALARICDEKAEDRATIMWKLWQYINAHGLLQDEEKKTISCDELLRAVFKCETITFPQLSTAIQQHLTPLPPLSCPYTIRLDPDYASIPSPSNCSIYDIRISCPPPIPETPYMHGAQFLQTLKQIRAYNEHIALLVQKTQSSMAKHRYMQSFAEDPANFLKKWMGSQRRDMEVILGERWGGEEGTTMGGSEFRRGGREGVWGSEKVREAVGLMVSKEGKRA